MNRRSFLEKMATLAGASSTTHGTRCPGATVPPPLSRFKLGSISDEWSQDFEEALKHMRSYGLQWVEIRTLWNIYNTEATPEQLQRMKALLQKYEFKVSVLDTALYKCALPGTEPVGKEKDVYPYSEQIELLKRATDRAHQIGTDRLRVFSFWRVENPADHFNHIAEELAKAAEVAKRASMRLVLENESACNVATGHELARMLKLLPAANLGANWDVGNGYWQGEVSFPIGYEALPKRRIWHMHLKDVRCEPGYQNCGTAMVGEGRVDLVGQFQALLRNSYQGTMSLEPEYEDSSTTHLEATRRSLDALLKLMALALSRTAS